MLNTKVVPQVLFEIAHQFGKLKATPFLVGGCVRDMVLGLTPKDFDVEVYGVEINQIVSVLSQFGRVDTVGKNFGVTKLFMDDGSQFDFTLPRRENKVGVGTHGFEFTFGDITPNEASKRRDFTINAMMLNLLTDELLDFFGGMRDIEKRVLDIVSPSTFIEDESRVLRAMQFLSRFDFTPSQRLIEIASSMVNGFHILHRELVLSEWLKWANKSIVPSRGLQFLLDCGWLTHFPELLALVGVQQDATWHPEGDVWQHTLNVVDAMAFRLLGTHGDKSSLMFGALCHDLGKASTTTIKDGRFVAPAHDVAGESPTRSFMSRLFVGDDSKHTPKIVDAVVTLVVLHMRHVGVDVTQSFVRKLSKLCIDGGVTITDLQHVVWADKNGRPFDKNKTVDVMTDIVSLANELNVIDLLPKPIIGGKTLIERGMEPSPQFKTILSNAFEAQLSGEIFDSVSANNWLNNNTSK